MIRYPIFVNYLPCCQISGFLLSRRLCSGIVIVRADVAGLAGCQVIGVLYV